MALSLHLRNAFTNVFERGYAGSLWDSRHVYRRSAGRASAQSSCLSLQALQLHYTHRTPQSSALKEEAFEWEKVQSPPKESPHFTWLIGGDAHRHFISAFS